MSVSACVDLGFSGASCAGVDSSPEKGMGLIDQMLKVGKLDHDMGQANASYDSNGQSLALSPAHPIASIV